ncbi:hypothetical protein BMS3Bbin12_00901 [bacterium BMS3Bbin12]|nr:hypothetical protein BMS3Bbin12_00901 [bacterium BMS3Bbin12]GBE51014.1 hypothetical protein BMS3Bbin13_01967 [bacterium BMS3Bbin13]
MHDHRDNRRSAHGTTGVLLIAALGLLSAACVPGGGSSGAVAPTQLVASVAPTQLAGSVGDGPMQDATVTVTGAGGRRRARTHSDITAKYTLTVPTGTAFPVRISATGGTDMVSGTTPDFTLTSAALSPDQHTANLTPITTLIVRAAEALPGGLTTTNLDAARKDVMDTLSFGLDPAQVPDPITTPVTTQNIAGVLRANEALAELVRRTRRTLETGGRTVSGDRVLDALAADVSDGALDGRGAAGTDPRISATARAVAAQVLVETLENRLQVGGTNVTPALDNALRLIAPGAPASATVATVRATDGALAEARHAIRAARALSSAPVLGNLLAAVAGLAPGATPQAFSAALPTGTETELAVAVTRAATASQATVDSINTVANAPLGLPAPRISLTANPVSVGAGGSAALTWSVTGATSCTASGGWSGARPTAGRTDTGALSATTTYTLACSGPGGDTSAAASVTVDAAPGGSSPAPGTALIGALTVSDTAHAALWSVQSNLRNGVTLYGDRAYTISSLPAALAGSEWIRTANDSRTFTGTVVAHFTVPRAATVYIAHRDDIGKPVWLRNWVDSGMNLVDSEPKTYSLYRKDFTAGATVELGPNGGGTSSGMYTVAVIPTAPAAGGTPSSGSGSSSSSGSGSGSAPTPTPTPTPTVDHIPAAVNDAASTALDTPVTIAVLANDSGLQDVPVTVSLVGAAAHGGVTVNTDNTVRYTPTTDFAGTDHFTYQVRDVDGDLATATVTVTVTCATCSAKALTLSWDPGPQTIRGYRVYYGTTSSTATTLAKDVPVGTAGFNATTPSVQFNAWNNLGLRTGGTVCFRVTAYNGRGESGPSTPVCGNL